MATDNEQLSVEWAQNHLPPAALPPAALPLAVLPALILETRHLAAASVSPDAAVVRDADLSILAADDPVFDAYEHAVRAEYAMLPAAQFQAGRARILADFASRQPLFFTPVMQLREPRARANLARALGRLKA
jgi:predicted metal-dependent HD superfamily phosphohydrolase